MKDEESRSELAVGCVTMLIALVVGCVLNGFVLAKLWGWFVVPVFHLPTLGAAQAIGLSFIVRVFNGASPTERKTDEKFSALVAKLVVVSVGTPLVSLFFGWVLKGFL